MVSYHYFLCGGRFRESERHTRSAGQIPCKLRETSIRRSAVRLNTDPARLRTLVSGTSSFPDPCAVSGRARGTKSASSSFPIPGFPGDIVSAGRLLNRSISCVTWGTQPDKFKLPPTDEMVMYLNSSSVQGAGLQVATTSATLRAVFRLQWWHLRRMWCAARMALQSC